MSKTLNQTQTNGNSLFLNLSKASALAGFSSRHFRRIIEEEKIRTLRVGRKFFVLSSDFHNWKSARSGQTN